MIQVLQAPYTYYPNALRYANVDIKTDFGAEWYNLPCDDSYWNVIKPIFARLQSLKEEKWLGTICPTKRIVYIFR